MAHVEPRVLLHGNLPPPDFRLVWTREDPEKVEALVGLVWTFATGFWRRQSLGVLRPCKSFQFLQEYRQQGPKLGGVSSCAAEPIHPGRARSWDVGGEPSSPDSPVRRS